MKRRFQRYIVHTEILSTFHARVEYISVTKYVIETIGPMGANHPKIHHPLEARGPHLIHECLGDSTHHAKQELDRFTQFRTTTYATNAPLVTMRRAKSTPKLPFPFDDNHPHLIHPSLDLPHSPSQRASGSSQPFSTIHFADRPTDRQTDGPGECNICFTVDLFRL